MNFKKITLAITGVGFLAGMSYFLVQPVLAYRGDPSVQGPNCTPERKEAMVNAVENNDYQAWKELMQGKGKVSEVITEDNFSKFAEMRKLRFEGKIEEADQIRAELGLGLGSKNQKGDGNGRWSR